MAAELSEAYVELAAEPSESSPESSVLVKLYDACRFLVSIALIEI